MVAHGQAWQESEVDTLIDVWLNETIQVQLLGSTGIQEDRIGALEASNRAWLEAIRR